LPKLTVAVLRDRAIVETGTDELPAQEMNRRARRIPSEKEQNALTRRSLRCTPNIGHCPCSCEKPGWRVVPPPFQKEDCGTQFPLPAAALESSRKAEGVHGNFRRFYSLGALTWMPDTGIPNTGPAVPNNAHPASSWDVKRRTYSTQKSGRNLEKICAGTCEALKNKISKTS